MIQINLLPDNMKESSGPSSIGVIFLIFAGIAFNLVAVGVFIYLHFVVHPDYKKTEQHLEVRLDALKRKTKDYEKLKAEKAALENKTDLVKKLIEERVLWSNRIQDLAIFTNDRRVWISSFSVKTVTPKRQRRVARRGKKGKAAAKEPTGPTGPYHVLTLDAYSASRDINIPNDYRKDIVLTDWWKEHFQENGINDPAYDIKPLPPEYYKEEFYHSFKLELSMKPTQKAEPKKQKKRGGARGGGWRNRKAGK